MGLLFSTSEWIKKIPRRRAKVVPVEVPREVSFAMVIYTRYCTCTYFLQEAVAHVFRRQYMDIGRWNCGSFLFGIFSWDEIGVLSRLRIANIHLIGRGQQGALITMFPSFKHCTSSTEKKRSLIGKMFRFREQNPKKAREMIWLARFKVVCYLLSVKADSTPE